MVLSLRALFLGSVAASVLGTAAAAACPPATVADMKGLSPEFPQQFELAEFEAEASCDLGFSANPQIEAFNAAILGNPPLPPLAERLPEEPLVVAPYAAIGSYGGVISGLSKATESGTSDLLSIRHVNLVRFADDLRTLVPNIAKDWEWNAEYTELTFVLRKGHKWSDGRPFTAEDVAFWYNDLILNKAVYEETPGRWLFDGAPATVEAVDETTVRFTFPTPQPNILNRFAVDYGQAFQPKHFLGKYMDKYNAEAAALRAEHGFADAAEAIDFYYGGSDWKDVPSPLLKDRAKAEAIGVGVVPTLESHVLVEDNSDGRRLVANPYFHMVDTAGNQLPYMPEIVETYVAEREVQNLRIMNGDVVWKQQAVELVDFPLLKENEGKGDYTVALAPALGETVYYSFNRTHKDPAMRAVFEDVRFSRALSLALDRGEINEVVYLGQGTPQQSVPAEPSTVDFVTEDHLDAFVRHDPAEAKALLDAMGLKDTDGDGVRERADGKPLAFRIVFANQGSPATLHELARGYWADLGLRVDLREVTSDEYRANANNNDLDVMIWKNDGITGPFISQDATMLVPPFGDYFNPGNGFEWAAWKASDGATGTEPPEEIKRLWELADAFLREPLGTPESSRIGREIVDIHVDSLIKIGVVGQVPAPYVHRNDIANVRALTAKTYDYYWTYPYRPQQWFVSAN